MNDKYTYEVTDTGQYFYENDVRIFPDQFWKIIKKLEHKIEELDFELKECKERKLYSRRELERQNEQLKEQNRQLRLENGKLTHDLFWANKKIEEELDE